MTGAQLLALGQSARLSVELDVDRWVAKANLADSYIRCAAAELDAGSYTHALQLLRRAGEVCPSYMVVHSQLGGETIPSPRAGWLIAESIANGAPAHALYCVDLAHELLKASSGHSGPAEAGSTIEFWGEISGDTWRVELFDSVAALVNQDLP